MARVSEAGAADTLSDESFPERRKKLSTLDKNALQILKKYGELLATEQGRYFRSASGGNYVNAKQAERLVQLGYCRIDRVGESVFAVFLGKP